MVSRPDIQEAFGSCVFERTARAVFSYLSQQASTRELRHLYLNLEFKTRLFRRQWCPIKGSPVSYDIAIALVVLNPPSPRSSWLRPSFPGLNDLASRLGSTRESNSSRCPQCSLIRGPESRSTVFRQCRRTAAAPTFLSTGTILSS